MTVELQARHFELTPDAKDYVIKKVGRLDRYLPDLHATSVELEHEAVKSQGESYRVEITVWVDSAVLRSEELNPDLYQAIDAAADKMFRQIEKYKGKRLDRWHGRAETAPYPEEWQEDVESSPSVVRRKQFRTYAMNEAEAIEQLELLGHAFFIFLNAETGQMNVLYHRNDGGLGLLEPVRA